MLLKTFAVFRSSRRLIMTSNKRLAEEQLASNPYYDKYAAKIDRLKKLSPEEYEAKLNNVVEKKTAIPKEKVKEINYSQIEKKMSDTNQKRKTLKDIMNIDMLKDKTSTEISEIWKVYYKDKKNVVYATTNKKVYGNFAEKCKKYPTFVIPLPRNEGYEFFVSQFSDGQIHLAPVILFQKYKQDCPESLCVSYFDELEQDVVLVLGEYDDKILNGIEAGCLVNEIQLYYNSDERFELVKKFNESPDKFDHNELIEAMNSLSIK